MQAQLDLKDNFCSIVHARGLPDDTLADIMLIFAYLLVSCARSMLNNAAYNHWLKSNAEACTMTRQGMHDCSADSCINHLCPNDACYLFGALMSLKCWSSDFDSATCLMQTVIPMVLIPHTLCSRPQMPHVSEAALLYSAAQNCVSAKPTKAVLLQEDAPAHDSASAAAAELVAEEEQAATKAAAKKAKKLRQKLKAKKQAQPEPSASAAEPHDACTPSDDAHTPSNDAQPLSAASSQLSLSAGQHQAEHPQAHKQQQQQQQQQQQLDGATGTSLTASAKTHSGHVAAELEGLHLPSCDQAASKGHTDADFLQQLFCCPLTEVSHVFDIPEDQASVCTTAAVQQQCNAWVAGCQQQERLGQLHMHIHRHVSHVGSFY